ncbi:MAG: hypothetical protein ACYC7E_19075 [Armatimonadota bacterium]
MRTLFMSILFILSLSAGLTQAWKPADVKSDPWGFIAGFAEGFLAHELTHVLVATANGRDVALDGTSIVYPGPPMDDRTHYQIASAGFQGQWILSEVLLRNYEADDGAKPMSQNTAGIIFSHIAISAAYLVTLKDHSKGDIPGIADATGMSRDTVAALVAIPAALDLWRLTGKDVPKWVPTVSAGVKGVYIGTVWTF